MADELLFLGTAGARMVMSRQLRSSAGLVLSLAGRKLVIDPGPGTLVRFRATDPPLDAEQIDGVILTHRHIDHSTDVNVMIECMTRGGMVRKGTVCAPPDCLDPPDPVILHYLRSAVRHLVPLMPGTALTIDDIRLRAVGWHVHPVNTVGLVLDTPAGSLGLVADTAWTDRLVDWYPGCDILICNVVRHRPGDASHALHLCVDDVQRLLCEIRPRLAVLTHFGSSMLRADPPSVAAGLAARTGCRVVAAHDGFCLPLDPDSPDAHDIMDVPWS